MSEGRRVFITLIIAFSASLLFALISHFGLLSVIENSFYKPMVVKELEEFNDSLAQTVGKYIDAQDALFTLFAANPELQAVTQKDQDELLFQTRATLASDLLTETPGLEGLRIIGENGKTIYYSTFPQDFAARKGDEPAAYRNYPKTDIDFNTIAVSEGTKSRIFSDSENNRLIFSYPFYDNEMLFIGTIAFYVDAPSMLRYFIPTDRLMAQSSIHLWNSLKNEAHGFVFSVPENLETVCKNAAISSWNSKQKINSFEDTNGQNNNYLLISAENQNGFVSTVFNENVMHMPERTQRVIVLATIGLIFFISIICCIAKNAAVRHAESPKKAEEKEDKKLAEAAAEEVPVRIAEHEKSEPLMERFEDVFESLAAESVPKKKSEEKKAKTEASAEQFDYDSQQFDDALFEEIQTEDSAENDAEAAALFDEIYEIEAGQNSKNKQAEAADDAKTVSIKAVSQIEVEEKTQSSFAAVQPQNVKEESSVQKTASLVKELLLEQTKTVADAKEQPENSIEESAFETNAKTTGSTAAFLNAIDERMHQRQEIIEEYVQPVSANIQDDVENLENSDFAENKAEIAVPEISVPELDVSLNNKEMQSAEDVSPDAPYAPLEDVAKQNDSGKAFEITHESQESAAIVPGKADVPETLKKHEIKREQPLENVQKKHGLLSAGSVYAAENHEKAENQGNVENFNVTPARKSSLSSIFKEKTQVNDDAKKAAEIKMSAMQQVPSTVLTDISQHGLLNRGSDYRSNLPQKSALFTLNLNKTVNAVSQNADKQNARFEQTNQQKDKKMNTSFYDETLEELQPAVETETITSILSLQGGTPQLFVKFEDKENEQRGSFERTGIADRVVKSTAAKMVRTFDEPVQTIDNIRIENGVYRIYDENKPAADVKINYDFKRLVDSVLNS